MSHAEFFQRKRKLPAQKKEKILKDTLLQNFGLENIHSLDYNKKRTQYHIPWNYWSLFSQHWLSF